jgi:hypothetical protein
MHKWYNYGFFYGKNHDLITGDVNVQKDIDSQ